MSNNQIALFISASDLLSDPAGRARYDEWLLVYRFYVRQFALRAAF